MATTKAKVPDHTTRSPASRLLGDLGPAGLLSLAAIAGTSRLLGLPASYLAIGVVLYAVLAVLVAWGFPPDAPGPGIGPANRVTLGRAGLSLPVLALSLQPGGLGSDALWGVIAVSAVVLVLDGVDGRVARRTGTESEFGARFDMELDAALIMSLSLLVWHSGKVGPWVLLVWHSGKVGPWVLLIGLMRYLFVAAGWVWPVLTAELPPSLRRKVVCVVQGVVLLVALAPVVPVWMAVVVSLGGLVALTYSFAVDVRWALRSA